MFKRESTCIYYSAKRLKIVFSNILCKFNTKRRIYSMWSFAAVTENPNKTSTCEFNLFAKWRYSNEIPCIWFWFNKRQPFSNSIHFATSRRWRKRNFIYICECFTFSQPPRDCRHSRIFTMRVQFNIVPKKGVSYSPESYLDKWAQSGNWQRQGGQN